MLKDPIGYTIQVQRILLLTFGLSFLSLAVLLSLFDPYNNNFYIGVLFFLLLIFASSLFTLINFWWIFSIQKKILEITEVNKVLYHAGFVSALLIGLLVLQITQFLDNFYFLGFLVSYCFYRLWMR